ncbi:hypothetical protein [Ancylomarina sp. 16SWW S1-10-2]|uniref:hypothetical protein n=1 Tax=Ancylomarina sp. 16SWW S1-10-2 TaxID=2499681 RepID=UPI0012AE54EC|nr:hypothetical protein [Ancylomarina sp. 16SWW S1-10-2]MRT93534.1 hypothetical protein [Ancylomarina sp. 16SWW S1-10-2]
MKNIIFTLSLIFFINIGCVAQSIPAVEENIPFLVTFGADSETSWGDDDFYQIYFFLVPENHTEPIYIRVFDPEIGGMHDEAKGQFNTENNMSIYGGLDCWSNPDAQSVNVEEHSNSGNLLISKNFKNESIFDNKWYTFGPINPFEGEIVNKFGGRVFKLIVKGLRGDDGNLYKFFLSSSPKENKPVEGGNIFTYEYTFRLSNDMNDISQIYPYIDDKTISVEITNFDWDNDGYIRLNSVVKNGVLCDVSNENQWVHNRFKIVKREKNTSLELQFIKRRDVLVRDNNVVISVRNQYGELLPFFSVPIGGVPVYVPQIKMKPIRRNPKSK